MRSSFSFKYLSMIGFAMVMFWHVPAFADLYRYENENGDIILTTEPRKGLKLLEVIRDSKPAAKPAKPSTENSRPSNTASKPLKDMSKAYDAFIAEASQVYGIPVPFIKAVIKIESNFNPRAVSRVGAMGLMQLMPATAEHMKVADPFDPRQNIMGGTKYLRRLSDRYDGDINLILSGYHAGPGNVEKAGGIPFEKTQQYVKNVYSWYVRYRNEMQ
jgi:soluble lytic murein transglycosylase-like protein